MTGEAEWLATLRPSRVREVQAGATSWTSVDLVDVESGYGSVLREALELLGVRVERFRVGQGRHLVQALSRGPRAPFVVLACHGDEGSIVISEPAPEMERYQPFSAGFSPDDLRSFARLEGATVIATGCDSGHPALVRAVLYCGAYTYVAPDGGPFAYAGFFAPVLLFYELTEQRSLPEAVQRLQDPRPRAEQVGGSTPGDGPAVVHPFFGAHREEDRRDPVLRQSRWKTDGGPTASLRRCDRGPRTCPSRPPTLLRSRGGRSVRSYPLLDVRVTTPRLDLRGATDELLDRLAEVVRAGGTDADPPPYDDPMSFYETDPDVRVARWLRAIWRRRGTVEPDAWRLYFVVMLDGRPVGEQTLTGEGFSTLGTVTTFSWLSADERGQGLGREMRAAILHLAFDGLGAKEAASDAFVDNLGSNAISRGLGYEPNGQEWATRQGEPAVLNRWRLTRERWEQRRRDDIRLHGVEACHALLPLD